MIRLPVVQSTASVSWAAQQGRVHPAYLLAALREISSTDVTASTVNDLLSRGASAQQSSAVPVSDGAGADGADAAEGDAVVAYARSRGTVVLLTRESILAR